jgi:hypothetical protein
MYTDLHHIYPTDGFVNGKRSNYPFGETNGESYKSADNFSKLGNCTYPGYMGIVFEPADEYKGDFARTYFYMVTCYEEKLHDWYTNYGSTDVTAVLDGKTYPGLSEWQLNMLMEWAKNDPVSEKETNRNNAVYSIQNNRNPFIDYPGLEEYIWGSMTETAFSYDNYVKPTYKSDVTMAFSPTVATATIGESFTEPTLSTTPANLSVTYSSSDPKVATVNASSGEVTLVAVGTTTITATFAGNASYNDGTASYTLTVLPSTPVVGSGKYELVNDASTLAADDKILIAYVSGTTAKAMSATQNSNNRSAVNVTLNNDGTLTPGADAQVITLEKDDDNYLFNVGNGYLYAASSSSNYLRTGQADANAKASIGISNGDATITFQGSNTRNTMRYNPNNSNNSPLFSCYASNSTAGSLPQIYREVMIPSITLANAADNGTTLSTYAGKTVNVTLSGRTLYKDGDWNTLCLPFGITSFNDTPINGATVMELNAQNTKLTGSTLTLNFTQVYSIAAGKPYIVKWTTPAGNISDPVFSGVAISSTTPTAVNSDDKSVSFIGTYSPIHLPKDDSSNLYLGSSNKLYYPNTDNYNINAFRAYFHLADGSEAREFVLNFGDDATGICLIERELMGGDSWYDLNGRKLVRKPTAKGVYLKNGRKVVVK